MHRFLSRVAPFALAALALFLAFTASDATAAPRGGQDAAAPSTALAGLGVSGTSSQPLVLVNGERIIANGTGGGNGTAVVRPPGLTGLAASLLMLQVGGATSLVPEAALPYLGHGLDPSLFSLSTLQRVERDGRLPVTLRYRGTLHAPPGVTVTHPGAGTATGYLTASSAPLFGNALTRQMLADHTHAGYGSDGLFAGGLTISVPGAAPAPVPDQHRFPMHTLTVHGTNLAGRPDTGDQVQVLGVSDPSALAGPGSLSSFYHGVAKYSVPSGTYWAVGSFFTGSKLRVDILPQFTVRGDTSIALRAGAASSELTIVTPRPAVNQAMEFDLLRLSPGGSGADIGWFGLGVGGFWVSPVSQAPALGTLQAYTSARLGSPAGQHGLPYSYALDFPAPPGTVPPQHFTVGPGDIATIHDRFYQDAKTVGGWLTAGGTASQIQRGYGGFFLPLPLPGGDTQYVSASPVLWQTTYYTNGGVLPGGQTNSFQSYKAGENLTEDWNAYPLHPAPNVSLPGAVFDALLSAARAAGKLILDITPFSDNTVGHLGTGYSGNSGGDTGQTAGRYAIYDNGTRIAHGNAATAAGENPSLFLRVPLSPKPSQVKVVVTASRKSLGVNLSSASRDVWTWPSRPDPQATVPAPWECGTSTVGHRQVIDRHCVVQDMLVPGYTVAGLRPDGTHSPGTQSLALSIGHLQEATQSRITHAQVQVSVDNGTTWETATVTRTGPGQFTATYTAPASSLVSLRVTARDAQGATITETIDRAYQTSA